MKSLSRVRLFATSWTTAYKAPLSTEFSRQEYWSGLSFPSPGDLPIDKFRQMLFSWKTAPTLNRKIQDQHFPNDFYDVLCIYKDYCLEYFLNLWFNFYMIFNVRYSRSCENHLKCKNGLINSVPLDVYENSITRKSF